MAKQCKKRVTNCYTVPVDHNKFYGLIKMRGLTATDISLQMSRANGYIKNKVKAGFFGEADAVFMEKVLNISREDYAPDVKEEEPEEINEQEQAVLPSSITVRLDDEQLQKLGEIIYESVLRAWSTPA